MEISQVDPDDRATVVAFVEVSREAVLHGDSHDTPYTHDELLAQLRNLDPAEHSTGYVGRVGDRVVASAMTVTPELDNREKAYLEVWVEPASRRRGYGSAMARHLVRTMAAAGRTTLMAFVDYPMTADESHPYRAFAVAQGFEVSNLEVHRVLSLPVDNIRLQSLLEQASPHHVDYTFAEFEGDLPPEIMPAYCELLNALMTDSPTGSVDFQTGGVSPDDFAKRLESLAEQRRTLHSSVAFDAQGRPVAHSELVVPADDPGKVFQWSTLVHKSHRGHRLGLVTKVRNVRWVQGLHPDRKAVHTWNAESNTHMVAVNEQLGFVPVGYNTAYVRRL